MTSIVRTGIRRPGLAAGLVACLLLAGPVHGDIVHDTQSDFQTGIFTSTVLLGTESIPDIRLASHPALMWVFTDTEIAGWDYLVQGGGSIATEDPPGQIHLRAESSGPEAYGLARRSDVTVPMVCVVEFDVYFAAIQPADIGGTHDQPRGGCARLDVVRESGGFRLDIFTDRMVSIYREGTTGYNYPTLTEVEIATETERWYTFRFVCDFNTMLVDVYRDGDLVGTFLADDRNAATRTLRMLAYSRTGVSGLAEFHIDAVRLGTEIDVTHTTGSYTSDVLHVGSSLIGTLSWSEVSTLPYPWTPWVKSASNPIIPAPCLNENILCDADDPLQQPLLYDGQYWMAYATGGMGGTIRLAHTTDPTLMTWTPYAGNPILSPGDGPDGPEDYVFSPHLFKDGDTYYLFYDVRMSHDGRQRNAYATATSPTGPWTKGQIILDLGAEGEWDDLRVTEPYVWKEGDTYFLYYMGETGCLGCAEQIGLATTPAHLFPLGPEPGGLWTKHGLVLPHDPDPEGWDRGLTADPSIIRVGDVLFMRYTGSYANVQWELGTAWATNPYGPWQRAPEPDIRRGPPGSWDSDRLVRGAIHYHDGRFYSPYTGHDGGAYRGGIASSDAFTPPNDLLFATRTSPDGITWEDWQPVVNGGAIQSSPGAYLQYQTTFNAAAGISPGLLRVTIELQSAAELTVAPLESGPFNCAQTATLTYSFSPADDTPAVRGYEVRLVASSELALDPTGVTIFTVPPGAETFKNVVVNGPNDLTVYYAVLGDTPGIITDADLFTLEVQGADPGGIGTVAIASLIVRDLDNQTVDVTAGPAATVIYDCTPPAPVHDVTAMPGHQQIAVAWQHDAEDTDHYVVYRGLWYTDVPETSAYPLYGRQEPSTIPGRPASVDAAHASDEWSLVAVVDVGNLSFTDETMTTGRGIYYYEVFAVDAVGNASDPAAENARATNYWLGDVNGDGLIDIVNDITALANSFGVCDGHPSFDPHCDVGPTDDMSRLGIPVPDGCVNFEDLMIFAMNFGLVAPLKQQPPGSPVHLAWVRLEEDRYALRLTGGEGLLGLRVRADVPPGLPVAVTAGDLLAQQDGATFLRNVGGGLDVSVAVLGTGQGFTGTGDLFLVSLPFDLTGEDLLLDARGVGNDAIMVSFAQVTGAEVPRAFSLSANFPNPFNPATTIRFALPEAQPVRLAVYGVDGRRVARLVDATYAAGVHEVTWHGTDDRGQLVAAGTYFYRIDAGPYQQVRKMVLVK